MYLNEQVENILANFLTCNCNCKSFFSYLDFSLSYSGNILCGVGKDGMGKQV